MEHEDKIITFPDRKLDGPRDARTLILAAQEAFGRIKDFLKITEDLGEREVVDNLGGQLAHLNQALTANHSPENRAAMEQLLIRINDALLDRSHVAPVIQISDRLKTKPDKKD